MSGHQSSISNAAATPITLRDIEQATADAGERWSYVHVRRVLALAQQIDTGLAYDAEAFAYAVYLHDWGAFPRWRQAGVDHALRSRQVAEQEILPFTTLSSAQAMEVLEAIERHDFRDARPVTSTLALLRHSAAPDPAGRTVAHCAARRGDGPLAGADRGRRFGLAMSAGLSTGCPQWPASGERHIIVVAPGCASGIGLTQALQGKEARRSRLHRRPGVGRR